jgi:hypothetical protein
MPVRALLNRLLPLLGLLLSLAAPGGVLADSAPFDLTGPTLRVMVTHAGATLPIAEVPNLAAGDQLSIRADLPPGQSVRYLLVAAFLRGATNPPPPAWFHKAETWTPKGAAGLAITVPDGAQQVVLFLAPRTGGDFKTLIDAVRGRPGAFVRASQDLNQAALDRSRLDAFLAAVRKRDPGDPDRLKTVSPLLARSLTIKLNTDCFQRMPELQAACLSQGQDSLVLSDGHSASIVDALTTGPTSDLAFQLTATPQAGFGYASPYVAAVMDIARILDSFGTARYQYIPALATAADDRLALLLNTPPSFHSPLSVLVTALPAVEPPQAPPLQPVDPADVYCAERTDLVLPVEGAPLAYSTQYAHNMALTVKTADGGSVDLPVRADAESGGFVANTAGVDPARFGDAIDGELHGQWGFQPFAGPAFHLQNVRATPWRLADDDQGSLIVGRDDAVRLKGRDSACVASVSLAGPSGDSRPVVWKVSAPDEITVTLPLADAQPGALALQVKQYGMKVADVARLQAFAQAGKLESFTLHAGDGAGVLTGSRLDEVAGLTVAGVAFHAGAMTTRSGGDELALIADDPAAAQGLHAGQTATAKVALRDGRNAKLKVAVAAARPQVALIGKTIDGGPPPGAVAVELGDPNEMPQSARLTFSVRTAGAETLNDHAAIEVATDDGSATVALTPAAGLTLEDAHVALAALDPAKALGGSAFGALKFRLVQDGAESDWQPLVKLVRLPVLRDLRCREGAKGPCQLSGSALFLIDSVSDDASFDHAVKAPEGFTGGTLPTPHPTAGKLFVRLRDDPGVVGRLVWSPGAHGSALATAAKPAS